nr:hypothetical protein [Tanacetum cinerariifolium]
WLAAMNVEMMDGVIVDWGEGIGVTVDEPVVKMDSIPGSIVGFNRIEESVNAQLEAEVLNRSSHSSRTSYAVAADLSEMELKKILIDKMEGNKSLRDEEKKESMHQPALHLNQLPGV